MDSSDLLKQAHSAIKNSDKGRARHLLQEAIRQDPQDYRAWLWLASVTASPSASLEYVKRAEMLNPHNAHVAKARVWAEGRLRKGALTGQETEAKREKKGERGEKKVLAVPAPIPPQNRWQSPLVRLGAALIIILLLTAGSFLAWTYWLSPLPATTTVAAAMAQDEIVAVAQATAVPETILPTMTPSATAVPIQPKNVIAASDNPRATWTLTPTPTNTPIPTDTPPPTYVSESGGNVLRGRPLGVAASERWIDVDLSAQTLIAYEGNEPIFETLISSGTYDHPTVTGQFRIWLKYEAQTMDGSLLGYDYYLENVPYVMYFYNDYALHGTFWHSNFGTPMSHGCVNMETSDAQWVFSWAGVGTVVNVHY